MTKTKFKEVLQGLIQTTGNINITPEERVDYIVNQLETLNVINLEHNMNKTLNEILFTLETLNDTSCGIYMLKNYLNGPAYCYCGKIDDETHGGYTNECVPF